MTKPVRIYTTNYCPYCVKAKLLLERKGIPFQEIDVTGNQDAREKLVEMSGGRKTVPQIFIGDVHVGGCDDLYAADADGRLDGLLLEFV
jgi:glutaredoxin 3